MVLFIIFLEDKHKMLLHLSIMYECQQFFQHCICFSIQPPDYSDPWPRLAGLSSFFSKYCCLTIQAFFSIGIYFFYFISNNNCRLLTTVQVFDIIFDNSARHLVSARNDERMNSDFFLNIFMQKFFNRIYVGKYTINMFFMLTSISLF
jgi:hypothetical protein